MLLFQEGDMPVYIYVLLVKLCLTNHAYIPLPPPPSTQIRFTRYCPSSYAGNIRYLGSIPLPADVPPSAGSGHNVAGVQQESSVVLPWYEPVRRRNDVTPLNVRFPTKKVGTLRTTDLRPDG